MAENGNFIYKSDVPTLHGLVSPLLSGSPLDSLDLGMLSDHEVQVVNFLDGAIKFIKEKRDQKLPDLSTRTLLPDDPDDDDGMIDPDQEEKKILSYINWKIDDETRQHATLTRIGKGKKGPGKYSTKNQADHTRALSAEKLLVMQQARDLFVSSQRRKRLIGNYY